MNAENKNLEERFISFIITVSQSAMLCLGKIANPLNGKVEKNLEGAKATIDMLALLKEKTRGNLSDREERFFESTLSTLRMNYVEELKESQSSEQKSSPEQTREKKE